MARCKITDGEVTPLLMLELPLEMKEQFRLQSQAEDLTMKQLGRKIIREYLTKVRNEISNKI